MAKIKELTTTIGNFLPAQGQRNLPPALVTYFITSTTPTDNTHTHTTHAQITNFIFKKKKRKRK